MTDLPAIKYLGMAAKAAAGPDAAWLEIPASANDRNSIIAHARTLEALAKYEPEPVDPARALIDVVLGIYSTTRSANTSGTDHVLSSGLVQEALAQYKAERPTITDDEALLIAREICARVAAEWGINGSSTARNYRNGAYQYDNHDPIQFALAMVKRDPAALEAFRGVGK